MTPEKEIEMLKRRAEMSRTYWIRAAKKALDGDLRELRNRVEIFEADPAVLVLSKSSK
jgi:hypothetical protein